MVGTDGVRLALDGGVLEVARVREWALERERRKLLGEGEWEDEVEGVVEVGFVDDYETGVQEYFWVRRYGNHKM